MTKIFEFVCPNVGEITPVEVDGVRYYLHLGRDPKVKGAMLAIITEGCAQRGDKEVTVCTIERVWSQRAAAEWFAQRLTDKPWIHRH